MNTRRVYSKLYDDKDKMRQRLETKTMARDKAKARDEAKMRVKT